MKFVNWLFLICSLCFFSCNGERKQKEGIVRLVTEWKGKVILFPSDIVFTRYATDTVDWEIPQSKFKILVYVDSIGCTSCKLQLFRWKELITYTDSVANGNVTYLFFFQPKDVKEINYSTKRDAFTYPVCVDVEDTLNKLNHFSSNPDSQTFLLDQDNKVVAVGNPIMNPGVKDLYCHLITGEDSSTVEEIKTTVSVSEPEIDLGTCQSTETTKAVFTLTNTGNHPLVILGTATTCGCTSISFDKEPASHGNTLHVYVEMSPKERGFFSETITVKCNITNQIKLTIKGQAI